ncbi:MAG: hypothetical protein AAF943_16560 [Pseudomonadota bacterium]
MKIFYGIDGTSNSDKSPQANRCDMIAAMKDSPNRHVKRIMRFGFSQQMYVEGTFDVMTGTSSGEKIRDAVAWLKMKHQNAAGATQPKIYVSGFSRGAASALCIGHELEKLGIPVEAMYLFDAVDRASVMPNHQTSHPSRNVKQAFHALRNPSGGSRRTFGNCGTENRYGNLATAHFLTTHGGAGGWPHREEDKAGPVRGFGNYPGAALVAGAAYLIDRAHTAHILEHAEPLPTNITPQQELAGMRAAWDWMSQKVALSMR